MNGQSAYYQYQVGAQGNSGLFPQTYLAAPGSVMAGQTLVMTPSGYTLVPPPPPPTAAVNPTPDYAGSTISAPASLYSQNTTSNSETIFSQSTQVTAATGTEQSVVTTSVTSPMTAEVAKETKPTSPVTTAAEAAVNYAQMNSAASSSATSINMTQQTSIQAIQQQQAIELQQALAARTPLPGYGIQKPSVQPQMQQYYNPYAAAAATQPTIVMDAYGRQYVVQHTPAQPKMATYPMVGGQNLVHPSYMQAGAPTKLHTTTTLELPSQQQALQNLYFPNSAMAQQQQQQQQALALQGYYNPAAAVAPQTAALPAGSGMRQQLVQYNGQTYLTYMPQPHSQVVQRKY